MDIKGALTDTFSKAGAWMDAHPMKAYSMLAIVGDCCLALNAAPYAGEASLLWSAAVVPAWIGHGVSLWRGDSGPQLHGSLADFGLKDFGRELSGTFRFIKETFTTKALFNEVAQDLQNWREFGRNALAPLKTYKDPYAFLFGMTTITGAMFTMDAVNVFDSREDWDTADAALGGIITTGSAYSLLTRNPNTGARFFSPGVIPVMAGAVKPTVESIYQSIKSGQVDLSSPNLAFLSAFFVGVYLNYTMTKINAAAQVEAYVRPSENDCRPL